MPASSLAIHAHPEMHDARMVLGFSGWMDGGDVSTGAVEHLIEALNATDLAEIEPEDFYVYSFPGSMEVSALFRPACKIEQGLVTQYVPPRNVFYACPSERLILFEGKEPHLHWRPFAERIFEVAARFDVRTIYFIGSVGGVTPHSREPRLFCSMSDVAMRAELAALGVRFSDYQGPASFTTYLTACAVGRGVRMVSLVAEIPAYVQGRNPCCIESVVRRLAGMLGLPVSLDTLRAESQAFEEKLTELVAKREDLAELVGKLESDYDSEIFDTQMGDLKCWLEQKGIRLD